jgi:SPP1 gp7 family putative phage head morphogenesis protein
VLAVTCDCGRVHALTQDKAREAPGLVRSRRLEEQYARDLRRIARQVGLIVRGWAPDDATFDLSQVPALKLALERYAQAVEPWAKATAGRMLNEIAIRERRSWAEHAKAMSKTLRDEIRNAPTGETLRQLLATEVENIASIPRAAGERVYELTLKGLEGSTRAPLVAQEIMRSGDVAVSRANMLARTSVAATASSLTEARARHVGSEAYAWRTSRDVDVRPSHRRMEGRVIRWDRPPTIDGYTAHAGRFANCRCYPEPILPEY